MYDGGVPVKICLKRTGEQLYLYSVSHNAHRNTTQSVHKHNQVTVLVSNVNISNINPIIYTQKDSNRIEDTQTIIHMNGPVSMI